MILNELGTVVEYAWLQIPKSRTNVILDAFVVMPNHLHGILILIDDPDIIPSGLTVPSLARNSTLQSGSLGATIGQFKSAATKRWNTMARRPSMSLWQRNYHEHIIRNEQSLIDIRAYIFDNPARWAGDELYVK